MVFRLLYKRTIETQCSLYPMSPRFFILDLEMKVRSTKAERLPTERALPTTRRKKGDPGKENRGPKTRANAETNLVGVCVGGSLLGTWQARVAPEST